MPLVQTPETIFPLALSPEDAAAFISLSRRALSDLIAAGTIIAKKHGARTLVDVDSLRAYYGSLPKALPGSIPNAPQSHPRPLAAPGTLRSPRPHGAAQRAGA